jgi:hypothetical protein
MANSYFGVDVKRGIIPFRGAYSLPKDLTDNYEILCKPPSPPQATNPSAQPTSEPVEEDAKNQESPPADNTTPQASAPLLGITDRANTPVSTEESFEQTSGNLLTEPSSSRDAVTSARESVSTAMSSVGTSKVESRSS